MNKDNIEIIHKEIDLIQNCITRMAQNSFLLKGWAISLVVVVLALTEKIADPLYLCLVLFLPLISFWYLDAFFLQIEKMYRELYKWVLDKRNKDDYDHLYDLDPHRFKSKVDSRWKIMWSVTLRCFYMIPLLVIVTIFIYQLLKPYIFK